MSYQIPAGTVRGEIIVQKSRFVFTAGLAGSAEKAKSFVGAVRDEMPDASHHVYAFRAGHGNSVTEGLSDDGEPSGTSGPPVLSILRGSNIGDIVVVISRYFGGTKLGTGGLVRAYSNATRAALDILPLEEKVEKAHLAVKTPYALYEISHRLIEDFDGEIITEGFKVDVTIEFELPLLQIDNLNIALKDATSGQVELITLE